MRPWPGGVKNESAGEIFEHVNEGNRYRFDQTCRVKAVQLASQLGTPSYLSINFMPNAVYRPDLRGRRFRRWQSCHRNCSNVEVDVQIVRVKTSDRGAPCLAGLRSVP